ncbi:MAG TPA: hypothetical protein VK066_19970 [Chloroflexota bacterium]|nr:hypothetical protein [Chloroflexota bacterium]
MRLGQVEVAVRWSERLPAAVYLVFEGPVPALLVNARWWRQVTLAERRRQLWAVLAGAEVPGVGCVGTGQPPWGPGGPVSSWVEAIPREAWEAFLRLTVAIVLCWGVLAALAEDLVQPSPGRAGALLAVVDDDGDD